MSIAGPSLIHPATQRGLGWLLGPRLGFFLMWGLVGGMSLPPMVITGLVAVDLICLVAAALLIRKDDVHASGPTVGLLVRITQIIVLTAGLTQAINQLAQAHASAPPQKPAAAQLPVEGTAAFFTGPITLESYSALSETLRAVPRLTELHLTSNGGNIPAARGMARLVLEAGLHTKAVGRCASACTLVFAAGAERRLTPGAQLGFHAYRLNTGAKVLSTAEEQNRDRAFLAGRGLSPKFLKQAFATRHEDMWFPSPEILFEAGVLTPNP
jgi:hypothetical protein